MHLRVDVLERPAVQEQRQLRPERDAHGDDGGQVERVDLLLLAGGELAGRHDDQDQTDRAHEEGEDDVARRRDARLARRKAARIHLLDGAVAEQQHDVGERVEDGVGHGGEEGEGPRADGAVQLQARQHDVGGERAAHRDLVLEVGAVALVAGLLLVRVDGLEEGADAGVLLLVVPADRALARDGLPGADGDEPVAGAPLARHVGADGLDLVVRLELFLEPKRVRAGEADRALALDIARAGPVVAAGEALRMDLCRS